MTERLPALLDARTRVVAVTQLPIRWARGPICVR